MKPTLRSWVRLRRKPEGGVQLVFPEGLLELNETGARVIALCDGQRSIDDIVAELARQFSRDRERITMDVLSYIERLKARGLLE